MKIKKFDLFEDGDGFATLGNSAGMGDVVAPQVGEMPGIAGNIGSGDLVAYDRKKYFGKKIKRIKKTEYTGDEISKENLQIKYFSDWKELDEKTKSKSQQRLFGMAYAVRIGDMKKSDVNDSVLKIVNSDMSNKEIQDFAKTKHDDID